MLNEKIFAFLTVRTSSTRLPNKCFLPFGSNHVLGHVIQRCEKFDLTPVICTTTEKSDDRIEEFAIEHNVMVFRGSLENKLKRWSDCADIFGIKKFHTVDVDDPFFEPAIIKESMDLLTREELDVVFPTNDSAAGSASVGYSIDTNYLSTVLRHNIKLKSIEMVDSIFLNDPSINSKKLISSIPDSNQIRLTLDYEEDYHLLVFLVRKLGPFCDRSEILEFFRANPILSQINWFRNEEWAAKQSSDRLVTIEGLSK
jgi:spore coat polysaccharide biosynthesis protein SpsF (cytidylyltransferase family)